MGEFKGTANGAFHAASHWQVATNKEFERPVMDSWKPFENWYYEEDRQKDDDLTDEKIKRFQPGATYYWPVRYRDQHLNWSDWPETASFKTDK